MGRALMLSSMLALGCNGILDTTVSGLDTTTSGAESTTSTTAAEDAGTTSDSGADDTGTDTGGGDGYTPYGACVDGGPCPLDPMEACISDDAQAPTYSFCSATCLDVSQCPAPPGGTAPASCEALTPIGIPFSACVLRCETGATCPDGMSCTVLLPDVSWCTWPAP